MKSRFCCVFFSSDFKFETVAVAAGRWKFFATEVWLLSVVLNVCPWLPMAAASSSTKDTGPVGNKVGVQIVGFKQRFCPSLSSLLWLSYLHLLVTCFMIFWMHIPFFFFIHGELKEWGDNRKIWEQNLLLTFGFGMPCLKKTNKKKKNTNGLDLHTLH